MDKQKKKTFEYQLYIDEWFRKKTKLSEPEELEIIDSYLKYKSITPENLNLSADYKFKFYDLKSDEARELDLRAESVFKLSIQFIVNQFAEYFKPIEFDLEFEKINVRESNNENKQAKYCSKHDVQLIMSNKEIDNEINNQKIVIIFEYNEKKSHEEKYDSYKKIKSITNSDLFLVYNEKYENDSKLNLKNTIKKFIVDIFCFICTLLNNKNILSKIIYFENFEELDLGDDELENRTNIFNYIMDSTISSKFDAKKLFKELCPYDNDGTNKTYHFVSKCMILYDFVCTFLVIKKH